MRPDAPNQGGVIGCSTSRTTPHDPVALNVECQASTSIDRSSGTTAWDRKGEFGATHACGQGGCSHINTPNRRACIFAGDTGNTSYYTLIGASSNHPGGVDVGFVDGSVRFVKNTVGGATWRALATKAGGEVVSADQY